MRLRFNKTIVKARHDDFKYTLSRFVFLQMLSKNSFISTNHFFKGTKQLYLGEYYSMCEKVA